MFNVIFAVTRSVGWIAHWREMMTDSVIKIGRPRQIYVGNNLRQFVEKEQREDCENFTIKHKY
jgi:citrate synthase